MYKGTHKNSQRRADGLIPKNLMHGQEALTPEQCRENLVAAKKRVVEELVTLPKKHPRRRELALKQYELEQQIRAIRPKHKCPQSTPSHFVQVAKERLSTADYRRIMDEAMRRAEMEAKGEEEHDLTK